MNIGGLNRNFIREVEEIKMNAREWLDTLDIGLVTYDIYKDEFKCYGELPNIPQDYFLPIAN